MYVCAYIICCQVYCPRGVDRIVIGTKYRIIYLVVYLQIFALYMRSGLGKQKGYVLDE